MAKKRITSKPAPRAKPASAKPNPRAKPIAKPAAKARPARVSRPPASPSRWPFLDAPNFAVITLRRVFDEASPAAVTMVVHEMDGSWQFLDGDDMSEADASVVALQTMMHRDPTLFEVANLPRGWYAVRRSPEDPWWPAPNGQAIEEYYSTLVLPRPAD